MSSIKQRNGSPAWQIEVVLTGVLVAILVTALGTFWTALQVAAAVDDTPRPPLNPFTALSAVLVDHEHDPAPPVATGEGRHRHRAAAASSPAAEAEWSDTATAIAAAIVLLMLTSVPPVTMAVRRRLASRRRVDKAAHLMGRGNAIAPLTAERTSEKARRLGVNAGPGLVIGRAVATGQLLYQDWESCSVDIAGPRTGKTTSRVIPAVMSAPGPVVATSNKRDVVDATRGPRGDRGRVWVFDPQGIVDEPVSWWWNPLSYVTDEARAATLAAVFSAAVTKPDARSDAFFDNASLTLLANLLLAAAVGERPVTQVYSWLANSNDDEPAILLEHSDYVLQAQSVRGVVGLNEKTKGGIYGGAMEKVAFLANRRATRWVTPPASAAVEEFRAEAFARSAADTLYLVSKEGAGTAGPLVGALTVAVCEAAEEFAMSCAGGRLSVPIVAVLDEAANVCRWPELPNLYSHYGSRGINVLTFLQSWSQGVEVWGHDGMKKLWSAANVNVYLGGVKEQEFLEALTKLIGTYQHIESSVNFGTWGQGRGTQMQYRDSEILDVADLAALDDGRMIVLAAGTVPTLARQQRWYDGRDAAAIKASIKANGPARAPRADATLQPASSSAVSPWMA